MTAILDDLRPAWGARPPLRRLTPVPHTARRRRVWHWAGPPARLFGRPHTACLAKVAAWQRYHQSKGWKDIGYPVLICVHARAIEGRGLRYEGSHSPSWNQDGWGVQYMVGEGESVTAAMYARGVRLAQDLEALAGHDLTDHAHHDDPKAQTECCGEQITRWVREGGPETITREDTLDMGAITEARLRQIIREELDDPETARRLLTGAKVLVNPTDPLSITDLRYRVPISQLVERIAKAVKA